ncbi:type VII secretion-associated serine protease mycosin [Nonomuraea longicatena]|uniref:Type VII secretion-associated serine protease mycosin n=1 Tax=Nonomuraea longicatena TaxID=83682 RepID=A0ABN1P5Z7_9ACTN
MVGRRVLAGALAVAALVVAAPVRPAQATALECSPERGTQTFRGVPWAQQRIDIKSAWRLTRGEGVTVAVIDSGVELNHPQLRVAGRADFSRTDDRDCSGHGTAVAGIIAAQYLKGNPFHGVAPAVRLLSLKHINGDKGDLAHLVEAIRYAARIKADVINVSAEARDQPDLRAAIEYALSRDVVVVAAAGNVQGEDGTQQPAYPAAYEGVLSVGSVSPGGRISAFSNTSSKVSVVAPGEDLTSTWPGRALHHKLPGTSFAAPYAAGVAALVRSRFPNLSQDQVRRRIEATADGGIGDGSGNGMVNPLYAITAVLPQNDVVVAKPPAVPLPEGVVTKVTPPDEQAITISLAVGGGALAVALGVVVGRLVVPMGRRRSWRAGRD